MALAATEKHRLAGVCLNDVGPVIDPAGRLLGLRTRGRGCGWRRYLLGLVARLLVDHVTPRASAWSRC